MEIAFFILAILMFIITFGIHSIILNSNNRDKPQYLSTPLALIPLISGFVLPVIPLSIILNYNWFLLFLINAVVAYIIGPLVTKLYLVRLSTSMLGKDMLYALCLGIASFIIALLIS